MPENKEKDMGRMEAEISLLKSNLRQLEKDNTDLKRQISDIYKNKHEENDTMKKRLNVFQKEYQTKSNLTTSLKNQISSTQRDFLVVDEETGIDVRYALKHTLNLSNLTNRAELEKLKFFRDYYFNDFFSIDPSDIVSILKQLDAKDRLFMEIYSLFCCKKEVFDAFLLHAFQIPFFIKEKIYILENVPVDWIVDSTRPVHGFLQSFIKEYVLLLVKLFIKIVDHSPGLLKKVLSVPDLNKILETSTAEANNLAYLICLHKRYEFVDETNINLYSQIHLSILYGREYFPFVFDN